MRRGETYSILPAYIVDGYLPCTGLKKGFFNKEDFFEWIIYDLLPLCNPYPGPRSNAVVSTSLLTGLQSY